METKTCSYCLETLPATKIYFNTAKNGLFRLTAFCKICLQIKYLKNAENIKLKSRLNHRQNADSINEKRRLKNKLNPEKYREQRRRSSQKNPEKNRQRSREYQKKNPEKIRLYLLSKKYKVDPGTIQSMMDNQKGVCAVCNTSLVFPDSTRSYAVDHDHKTGRVRGLLCANCNTALGLLNEDKDRIYSLINYIDSWATQEGILC